MDSGVTRGHALRWAIQRTWLVRALLALVFLGAGVRKAGDLSSFESVVGAHWHRITGTFASGGATYHAARAVALGEMIIGLALAFGYLRSRLLLIPVAVPTLFTVVHAAAVCIGGPLPCGCGVPFRPDSVIGVVLGNAALVAGAAWLCWAECGRVPRRVRS